MKAEIEKKLRELALKRSTPFCYGCYIKAPNGTCHKCGSDDLMRLLPGIGCEYGTDWIAEHILRTELTPVDLDQAFEDSVRETYPETTRVGWMVLDTASIMREADPVSWNLAQSEWESMEKSEGNLFSLNDSELYYWTHEVLEFLEREE